MKKKTISLISLSAVLAISAGALIGTQLAFADDETTTTSPTVSATSVFNVSSSSSIANVSYTTTEGAVARYPRFEVTGDTSVQYQKNLAYRWQQADGTDGAFRTVFQLQDCNFASFTVKFMSQQYEKTRDGVSVNRLVFVPNENKTQLYVYVDHSFRDKASDVKNDGETYFTVKEDLTECASIAVGTDGKTQISVSFGERDGGDVIVSVNDVKVTFSNVGGNYAKYQSSYTSYPCTPLSFLSTFADTADDDETKFVLESINGQQMALSSDTATTILDNTAPVLCFDSNNIYLKYNAALSLSYTTIDVLTSSTTTDISYAIVRKDAEGKAIALTDDSYVAVNNSYSSYLIQYSDAYVPTVAEGETEIYGLASVKMEVKDSHTNANVATYELSSYADNTYLLNDVEYIPVTLDEEGTYLGSLDADDEFTSAIGNEKLAKLVDEYQAQLDAKTADELKAGSDKYLYLPSVQDLLGLSDDDYRDGKVTVYYRTTSDSFTASSSMAYNALSLGISTVGRYEIAFTFTDAAGNALYYTDASGDEVKINSATTVKTAIEDGVLPTFTFDTVFTAPTLTAPDEQDVAYKGTSYTVDACTVNGISGTYQSAAYELYEYTGDYSKFADALKALKAGDTTDFEYIVNYKELTDNDEGEADYDKYYDYTWNPTNRSFVPQTANTYYVVKCTVKPATAYQNAFETLTEYVTVYATVSPETMSGETNWFASSTNVVAFVLYCIAGLSAIALLLVIFIKPKDKGDIDEIDDKKPKKSKKTKKQADLDE